GKPGIELREADWLSHFPVENTRLVISLHDSLDAGESEAIVLALEKGADLLLMDERIGRKIAQRLGLRVTGVIGVLIEAKHKGLLTMVKPVLDRLRDEAGFRLSDALYQQVVQDEHESG
ncbi:MAG: DUF3368 domain-containing protein, partial [Anaerolineales bacterium]